MFQVGDKVVYPVHGAGVIEAIEEKEVLGENKQYFIIKLSINNLQIMIPVENASKLHLRSVVDQSALENAINIFLNGETESGLALKERIKLNEGKIKSGKLQESVEVVRDLTRINEEKALNSQEKNLLNKARGILYSELVLVDGITDNQMKTFSF